MSSNFYVLAMLPVLPQHMPQASSVSTGLSAARSAARDATRRLSTQDNASSTSTYLNPSKLCRVPQQEERHSLCGKYAQHGDRDILDQDELNKGI